MCALKNNKVNESRKTVGSIFTITVRNYLFDAVAFELKHRKPLRRNQCCT